MLIASAAMSLSLVAAASASVQCTPPSGDGQGLNLSYDADAGLVTVPRASGDSTIPAVFDERGFYVTLGAGGSGAITLRYHFGAEVMHVVVYPVDAQQAGQVNQLATTRDGQGALKTGFETLPLTAAVSISSLTCESAAAS